MSDIVKQKHQRGTTPYIAEQIAQAVMEYHDFTARKHDCVGFSCRVCSFNGDRWTELEAEILKALEANLQDE